MRLSTQWPAGWSINPKSAPPLLVATMVAVLAACTPPTSQPKEGTTAAEAPTVAPPAMFQASYRVDAQIFDEDSGQTNPLVLIRDGQKTRMEMTRVGEGQAVILMDGQQAMMIVDTMGTRMAMRMSADTIPQTPDANWAVTDPSVRRLGPCVAAGETGAEYESTDTGAGGRGVACITSDGIILKAMENGRTVWEATRVQRGPQDPALFVVPPGVQIVDIGALMDGAKGQ